MGEKYGSLIAIFILALCVHSNIVVEHALLQTIIKAVSLFVMIASFFSHEGDYLIANAKPGYEFIGEGSPTHVGGASHGALHKQDTLVSMIITGTDTMPAYNRLVDIKEWILDLVKSRGAGE